MTFSFHHGVMLVSESILMYLLQAAAGCQLMFWSASGDGYLRADGDDWCIDWVEVKHQDGHVVTGHRSVMLRKDKMQ